LIFPDALIFHTFADNCPGVLVPVASTSLMLRCTECGRRVFADAPAVLEQLRELEES
jgi:hypothetical protein